VLNKLCFINFCGQEIGLKKRLKVWHISLHQAGSQFTLSAVFDQVFLWKMTKGIKAYGAFGILT